MSKPRDYQLDAVIKIFEQFQTVQRTLCVCATGGGKTQIAGYVAKEILARKLGRVMVVCHREELIRQAAHRFEQITGIKPEIEKADEWAGELDAYGKCPIVVASVQTLVSGRGTKRYTRFDPAEFAFLWVDECVVAGTAIDGRPIETMRVGDIVNTRTGSHAITHVFKKKPQKLVRVTMADGTSVICTPNHPFFVDGEFIPSGLLDNDCVVTRLITKESSHNLSVVVHSVWENVYRTKRPENMLAGVRPYSEDHCDAARIGSVHGMWKDVSGGAKETVYVEAREGVLFNRVHETRSLQEVCNCSGGNKQEICVSQNEGQQSDAPCGGSREGFNDNESYGTSTDCTGRQWTGAYRTGNEAGGGIGVENKLCDCHEDATGQRISHLLQDRRGKRNHEDRSGSGRRFPQNVDTEGAGHQKNRVFERVGVDCVEVLEPTSDGTFGGLCPDGFVYNLEVANDHTYFANGILVHNCHRSVSDTFTEVITHFCKNPKLKCLGVTATPDRADKEALGQIFQSVAFEFELPDIIEQGYLVPIKQRSVEIDGLDFSHVRTTAGDLNSGDLEEAMLFERPLHGTAFATIELSCGLANGTLSEIGEAGLLSSKVVELIGTNHRRKTLIFCTTVAHANRMADILNRWLPQSAVDVNGEMAKETRHKNITAFTKGNAQFLVNCMVLTEGADLPVTEIVVMARPTKSRALFSQMLGRGTRPAADIADVLGQLPDAAARRKLIELSSKPFMEVLDFVGNNGRHQLVSTVDVLGDADSPEVLELAKEYANTGKDVLTSLKDAREEIERRKIESEKQKKKREDDRARAEQAEIARRAKLVANADYRVTDHDPYAPQYDLELRDASQTEMAEVMQFCKDSLHKSQYAKVTLDNARKIKADILRRKYARLASWKQIRILEQNGWTREQTLNMPLVHAGAIMDKLFESWKVKS